MKNIISGIICIFVLVIFGNVCIKGTNRGHERNSTLTLFYGSNEWFLGPAHDDSTKFIMFLPLAHFPDACREKRTIGLAESWVHSEDYKKWTFFLRPDIRWHDGVPCTAHDIAFSIELWKHPDVKWYGGAGIESVSVIDDYTVEINFKRPGQVWTFMSWYAFYPKHLLESLDPKGFFEWEFWMHPVGNGPYRYSRHIPGTMTEFTANPDYYRGKPQIETLTIKLGSVTPAVNDLLSGSADVITLDPALAEKIAADNEYLRVYYGDAGRPIRLVWHVQNPLFKDREIRRALTMAIDRTILFSLYKITSDLPITEGPYSRCLYYRGDVTPGLPFDPEEAKNILMRAGWRDEDGDGIREKEGRPFQFTTIVSPSWHKAAVIVQDQLQQVGIKMEIQMLENHLVAQRFFSGNFEAALPRVANVDNEIGMKSVNGYQNPHLVQLLAVLSETISPADQDSLILEIAAIYKEDLPGTFLFPRPSPCVLAHSRIRGLEDWSLDWLRVDQLWIEEE